MAHCAQHAQRSDSHVRLPFVTRRSPIYAFSLGIADLPHPSNMLLLTN